MIFIKDNVERQTNSEATADKLEAQGFKRLDDVSALPGDGGEVDIKSLSVSKLKGLAKEAGIEGAASLNKQELLAVLKDVV